MSFMAWEFAHFLGAVETHGRTSSIVIIFHKPILGWPNKVLKRTVRLRVDCSLNHGIGPQQSNLLLTPALSVSPT